MCSDFLQRMENYEGDLADIVRASGGLIGGGTTLDEVPAANTGWQLQSCPMSYSTEDFGDPFSNIRDPLLDMSASGLFYNSSNCSTEMIKTSVDDVQGFGGGGNNFLAHKFIDHEETKHRPCNIFSRMLQISPKAKLSASPCDSPAVVASPRGLKVPPTLVTNDMLTANSSKGCLLENSGVQISSPRNSGIKRRKSQAKKVVCIPAPAPANSRPTGEVVPSDLWAWRKYGQKPIKGSPYPRGYYRCSSSKGCSARKQVERSRTDPNMLVITYTSEHNHPWPTQRNALAGSTRGQTSKANSASKNAAAQKSTSLKEEQKETNNTDIVSSSIVSGNDPTVKEEMDDLDKQMDMDQDAEFSEGFPQSYRPALPESNHSEDFFAELGELEGDPLNLLFPQGFSGDEREGNNKPLDPFSFYDWTGNTNSNSNNITSFGEAKRGL